jgi:hypothetical protein
MCSHQVGPYGPEVTTDDRTIPTSSSPQAADPTAPPYYEIRVKGHLAARWSAWFDGLELAEADDGTTVIRGPVVDQSALHGLLQKLRDVGLPLVSLTAVAPDGAEAPPRARRHPKGTSR